MGILRRIPVDIDHRQDRVVSFAVVFSHEAVRASSMYSGRPLLRRSVRQDRRHRTDNRGPSPPKIKLCLYFPAGRCPDIARNVEIARAEGLVLDIGESRQAQIDIDEREDRIVPPSAASSTTSPDAWSALWRIIAQAAGSVSSPPPPSISIAVIAGDGIVQIVPVTEASMPSGQWSAGILVNVQVSGFE